MGEPISNAIGNSTGRPICELISSLIGISGPIDISKPISELVN
jgi:hypothetical protein